MVNLQLFASALALVSGKSKPMGASLAPKKQRPIGKKLETRGALHAVHAVLVRS
jgi:hypothetical protein